MPASFASSTAPNNDSLLLSDEVTSRPITLISGQNLTRGAVLGKITASGKYTLSLSASADGSQTPDCILAEDTDASGGDKSTVAYFQATVNSTKLSLGTAHTVASVTEGLRLKDIHIVVPQVMY